MTAEPTWALPAMQNFHHAFNHLSLNPQHHHNPHHHYHHHHPHHHQNITRQDHHHRQPSALSYQTHQSPVNLLPHLPSPQNPPAPSQTQRETHPGSAYPHYRQPQFAIKMDSVPTHSMAEFQRLSNEYEPDLEGPLVGPKQPSRSLMTEYQHADPIYVAKTAALAQSHPYYRVMKGDGNCGWRAVAFGYFENLFLSHDVSQVARERARIKDFNALLEQVGYAEYVYETFVDATEELFNQVSAAINSGNCDDSSFLVDAFNDDYNSNCLITHFRMMTGAWIKLNSGQYAQFLGGIPIEDYCQNTIAPVKTEIDEVGLQALVNGIIQASGFAVEVIYLDRSAGNEAITHRLTPDENQVATIRLLYRPGHYDLLYDAVPQSTVHINLVTTPPTIPACVSYSQDPLPIPLDFEGLLMHLPQIGRAPPSYNTSSPISPPGTSTYAFPAAMHHRHYSQHPRHHPHSAHPTSPAHNTASPTTTAIAAYPTPPSPQPPVSPSYSAHIHPQLLPELNGADTPSELPIRINSHVYKPMNPLPLASVHYRNSHSNQRAHFQNPGFQPSIWDPSELHKHGTNNHRE